MTLNELLAAQGNDLTNHDLAVLADWAGEKKFEVDNPAWKRAFAQIREGADLLLRRRARSTQVETPLDNNRCAVCGWPLKTERKDGCVRGDCSKRPEPDHFYDSARAEKEYAETGNHKPEEKS